MLCTECGTSFEPGEYHPRAFCVLYNAGIDPYELMVDAIEMIGVETGYAELQQEAERLEADNQRLRLHGTVIDEHGEFWWHRSERAEAEVERLDELIGKLNQALATVNLEHLSAMDKWREEREEVERLEAKVAQYADCIMGMVCQHCQSHEPDVYMDMALSANEDAIALLEADGLAERLPGRFWRWRLCWDRLNRD